MEMHIIQLFKKMGDAVLPCMIHSPNLEAFESEGWCRTPEAAQKAGGDDAPDYSALNKEQLIELAKKATKAEAVKINAAVSDVELTDGKVADMRTELLDKLNEGE